jgi:gliding motility-associated-like protein
MLALTQLLAQQQEVIQVYLWQSTTSINCASCANTSLTVDDTVSVTLFYTDEFGCKAQDNITISILPLEPIYIPTGFSPNNDGVNDVFRVRGAGFKKFYMSIYNRWGELVFETTDFSQSWDGMYKSVEQEMGVYVYTINAVSSDSRTYTFKGNVTLIR